MKNTKLNESGRSMVEMLGVLAVIGVLSVAGIAGYSIAMRNYRANEIVNAASMFYVLAKAQNQGNGPSNNTDYETLGGKNPSGATLTYTNNAFTITFTDSDDCTMAKNKLGDKASGDCPTLTVNFGETKNSTPTYEEIYNTLKTSRYNECMSMGAPAEYCTDMEENNETELSILHHMSLCMQERWDTTSDLESCCQCTMVYGYSEAECIAKGNCIAK